jgi:hypothetical protein
MTGLWSGIQDENLMFPPRSFVDGYAGLVIFRYSDMQKPDSTFTIQRFLEELCSPPEKYFTKKKRLCLHAFLLTTKTNPTAPSAATMVAALSGLQVGLASGVPDAAGVPAADGTAAVLCAAGVGGADTAMVAAAGSACRERDILFFLPCSFCN